ncbi:MAG: hypothetical protein EAX96_14960 [Candidatus Lokiarchaeota archaeon]|nr:hypothetical protein [Candidatus Lokiarchaeota archaeon]
MSKSFGGSKFFGVILIIIGIFLVINGILQLFVGANLSNWILATIGTSSQIQNYVTVWDAVPTLTLAAFGILAGFGLFKEEEWAFGIGIVIFAMTIANSIGNIVPGIMTLMAGIPDVTSIFWIIVAILAAIGIAVLAIDNLRKEG